jgi:hypothetical protein
MSLNNEGSEFREIICNAWDKSRFFGSPPQTPPQRATTALWGPRAKTFGAPFAQNDSPIFVTNFWDTTLVISGLEVNESRPTFQDNSCGHIWAPCNTRKMRIVFPAMR